MSEQPLNLLGAMRIVWRQKIILGVAVLVGILASVAFGLLNPPLFSGTTLVMLPSVVSGLTGGPSRNIGTQMIVARSNPVLAAAGRRLDPAVPVSELQAQVQVTSPSPQLVAISGRASTAAQAEAVANAVAHSYVAYLSAPGSPNALITERATSAARTPTVVWLALAGVLGALAGVLVGAVVALTVGQGIRRLRQREDIADAIGVPVLASVSVAQPGDAAGWVRLLGEYEPDAAEAWNLRKALYQLGLADVREGDGASLAVVSLSADLGALALGPQLAAYAASLGMATAFVVGPQQDERAIAMLCGACSGPASGRPLRSGRLWVRVRDPAGAEQHPEALTVISAVVDAAAPRLADTMQPVVTVLGVSAGGATAEQLARVAVSVASDGRQIAGILVANPDRADHTTGRLPKLMPLGRPARATAGSRW